MRRKNTLLLLILAVFALSHQVLWAQGGTCATATPFCTAPGNTFSFTNVVGSSTGSSTGGSGANFNCLGSSPRPSWFVVKSSAAGPMNFRISQTNGDVDFIAWGPYSSMGVCGSGLQTVADCSYSTAATEQVDLNATAAGQYFVLLITNYNGGGGTISIQQNGGAATNCCFEPSLAGGIYTSTSAGSAYLDMVEGCINGQIDLWRATSTSQAATITYTMTGTATSGTDYNIAVTPGTVTFPAGSNHAVINITPVADGIMEGTETIQFDFIGCDGNNLGTATLNIQDVLPLTASATPTSVCQGSTTQLGATSPAGSQATYSWTPPSAVSNPNIANPTAVINANSDFIVTAMGFGCTTRDTVSVTSITPPGTPTAASPVVYCQNATAVPLTATGTGLLWYTVATGGTGSATAPTPSTATAGSTTFYVTQTLNGCESQRVPITVTIDPAPAAAITGSLEYCQGANTTLTATGGGTYAWSTPPGGNTANITVTQGTYTVTVTAANSCTATATATVTENPLPVPTINGALQYCAGSNTTLTASGGGTGGTYNWSSPPGGSNASITVTRGTYDVTVTDAKGCTATASATVTENALPVPVINGALQYCVGFNTTITADGAGTGGTYSWSSPPGGSNPSITVTQGTYTVTVTDANNCSASVSATIIETTNPTITIGGSLEYCENFNTTLTAQGIATGGTYNWSSPPGGNTQSITVTQGTYSVTATDANGCSGTTTVTVTENPTPVASITGIFDYCEGDSTTLTANGAGVGGAYSWSAPLGANTETVIVTQGTYTVTITDVKGCTASESATVIEKPNPVIQFTQSPNPLCIGQGVAVINAGLQSGVTYTWSTGTVGDTIVSDRGGITVDVVGEINGCTATGSYTIIDAQPPQSPVLIPDSPKHKCCADIILNPNPNPALTYSWSSGDTVPSLIVDGSNTVDGLVYSVTATDASGCTATASEIVNIWCIKAQGLASRDTIQFGSWTETADAELEIITQYDNGDFIYTWVPQSGLSPADEKIVTAKPLETTTYHINIVDDRYGCLDSVTIYLVVTEPGDIATPTAFTPNGDGKNDVFFPIVLSKDAKVHDFRVYNRWGELVHNDPNQGWDGKYKGEEQPSNEVYTFYFYAEIADLPNPGQLKGIKRQGSFTLLR